MGELVKGGGDAEPTGGDKGARAIGAKGSLPSGKVVEDWTVVGWRASHESKAMPAAIVAAAKRDLRIESPGHSWSPDKD